MKAKMREAKGMRWFVTAGIMFLAMVMIGFMPVKVKAASSAPTRICVPEGRKGKACVSVKLQWKKANGADGYVIYRSSSRFGRYKKIKDIKSDGVLAYNDSSVKEARVYYYKVRAYKNCNGKKVFAEFKSLKIDKVMKKVSAKKISFWGKIKNFFS